MPHLVYLNSRYEADATDPEDLLERYPSLSDWCEAMTPFARVSAVQRFRQDAHFIRRGVEYHFLRDGFSPLVWHAGSRALKFAAGISPSYVHAGGIPIFFGHLRRLLPPGAAILWQHHGGGFPRKSRWLYRRGFSHVDAFMFTSREQAEPWMSLIGERPVHEVLENSTRMEPLPYPECRKTLDLGSRKVFLWVGHLNENKDPLTVLEGFALALRSVPDSHLYMAYSSGENLDVLRGFARSHELSDRIHFLGSLSRERLRMWYSAADYFVLGSSHEGSGYALIESIACGAMPVVTDIPPFRRIVQDCGPRWAAKNAVSCCEAIARALKIPVSRSAIRAHFDKNLSFEAVASAASEVYRQAQGGRRM